MRYDDQPTEYDAGDATTAAPVPEAGEDEWSPLAESGADPEWQNSILTGDCFEVLADLPAASVHACVTDPPYGLAFMGRDWDDFEPREYQEWCEEWARAVKRVLKPGAHLLAFSGNRTHHRLFTGVEDAGFEVRDTLTWHYGSGFPKAADISKTIDKRAGAEREVVAREKKTNPATGTDYGDYGDDGVVERTEPATDAAKRWDGWKTGLKPATEFVVMARTPFEGATVDCVLEHGTGALNIDACRIGTEERENPPTSHNDACYADAGDRPAETVEGRYPSNVVFHEGEAERLDREVGELDNGGPGREGASYDRGHYTESDKGEFLGLERESGNLSAPSDSGGPSRYFYTSKASKAERTADGTIPNDHPTVKPLDLMEWLVRLVTREGQTVLDPFAGSGTTCKAAKDLGRAFVGIEQQERYADIARARCGLSPKDPSHVREDDDQQGLEVFADGGDG